MKTGEVKYNEIKVIYKNRYTEGKTKEELLEMLLDPSIYIPLYKTAILFNNMGNGNISTTIS